MVLQIASSTEVVLVGSDSSTWCVLDVETTGLHPEVGDRVIEVAVWSSVYGVWHTLLNPRVVIPEKTVSVHGIKGEVLVNAPRFRDIAPELASLVEGQVVIGHNICFDLRCLFFEFSRTSTRMPEVQYLDTIALGERLGIKRCRLATLANALDVSLSPSHRADRDVQVTAKCVQVLLERLGAEDLVGVGVAPFVSREVPVRGRVK